MKPLIASLPLLIVPLGAAQEPSPPLAAELVAARRIWDRAPHNAFTDLERFGERFFCAFREGRGHVSADGTIRVLVSDDLERWESAASIALDGFDLRDANLSITPDGRLYLVGGAAPRPADGARAPTGTFASFSADGREWTPPRIVLEPGRWMWTAEWHAGRAWGVSYPAGEGETVSLLASADGHDYQTVVADLYGADRPNEASLVFERDALHVLLRREAGSALFGSSSPPYADWQWRDLGRYLGGPCLTRTPDGRHWLAGGRVREGGTHTALLLVDPERDGSTELLRLPSGGDTSYPGFVWHAGRLWASYYSSHEGKTSIYLAEIRVTERVASGVTVTYLGNAGFLLRAGEHEVLVDALVGDAPSYVSQSADLRRRLERAEPPFDGVDLVLATHVHPDHFGAEAVGRHLAANPDAIFVTTEQAALELERSFEGYAAVRERVRVAEPTPESPVRYPELGLTVLDLHHGRDRRPPIQNNGFVIELGGLKLLHMGDTEARADELDAQGLAELELDVALVPSWYLDARPWKGAIETAVRPREVVAMHLAPDWIREARTPNQRESRARAARIREAYPDARILEDELAELHFAPEEE